MKYRVGLVIFLGMACGPVWAAEVGDYPDFVGVHVDSTTTNTWPTDAASYPLLSDWYRVGNGTGDIWGDRASTVALGGYVLESTTGLNLPQLTMTIDGLDPEKEYAIYVVYWSKINPANGDYFGIWAGMDGEALTLWDKNNSYHTFRVAPLISQVDGCEGFLGTVTGVTSVSIDVAGPVYGEPLIRGWFDGIAYDDGDIPDPPPPPPPPPDDIVCENGIYLACDMNEDCVVDLADFAMLVEQWLQ